MVATPTLAPSMDRSRKFTRWHPYVPYLIHVSLAHVNPQPKFTEWFSHFCTDRKCDKHNDRQTDSHACRRLGSRDHAVKIKSAAIL